MMYAYSEDELDKEREKLEQGGKIPDWLNDPETKPKNIKYNGDLRENNSRKKTNHNIIPTTKIAYDLLTEFNN